MENDCTVNNAPQIQIRFSSKQPEYTVPDYPLTIPASSVIGDLNTHLNELLKESYPKKEDIEFDFFLYSEPIHKSLIEHIVEKSISIEETINIEFAIKSNDSSGFQNCLVHEDWVSSVSVLDKWIVSGSYDNTIHLWSIQGKHHLTVPGHTSPVKDVAWIKANESKGTFVSVSNDHTAIIWEWDINNNSIDCLQVCRGHEKGLECVSINKPMPLMATGSLDCTIKIWSTSPLDVTSNGECSKKPRRESSKIQMPLCNMKGHREYVSGVVWSDRTELVSSSWDFTFRVWDAESGRGKSEMRGTKCLFDIDYSQLSRTLVTAGADKVVKLYDLRATETAMLDFCSHKQWVQSVVWSKTNEYIFVSGGYDSAVKIWDTRNPQDPLKDILNHEDKILDCNWSCPELLVTAGADNTVRIFPSCEIYNNYN